MLRRRNKNPCRRACLRKRSGFGKTPSPFAKPSRRLARQSTVIIRWTRINRKGQHPGDIHPALPTRKPDQVVRPHQPYELDARKMPAEPHQRGMRVTRSPCGLDGRGDHAPAIDQPPRRGKPMRKRIHSLHGLERVAGGYQQPDLVQTQTSQHLRCHMPMPRMGRVERAAEHTHADAAPIAEPRQRKSPVCRPFLQGRTCPWPRTK